MEKIVFECESVTPMFMYGANQNEPELRATSIKGALRFWWRAMNGNNSISDLKKAEDEIFGSTEKKSKVKVRAIALNQEKSTKKISKLNNIAFYLFFPIYMQAKKEQNKKYFCNLKFKIIISSQDKKALKEACYSFIILSIFGGLGSRSRRGGGSFKINKVSGENSSEYQTLLKINSNNLQQDIDDIYQEIKGYFNKKYQHDNTTKKYYHLEENLNFKVSSASFSSWQEALKDIENQYKDFREKNRLLDNVVFGLPIIKPKVLTQPKVDRLASPIIIKVIKVGNSYHWLVLKLEGNNLGENIKVSYLKKDKEKKGEQKKKVEQEINLNILEEFLEGLNNG